MMIQRVVNLTSGRFCEQRVEYGWNIISWTGGGGGRLNIKFRVPTFRHEFNEKQIYSRQPQTAQEQSTSAVLQMPAVGVQEMMLAALVVGGRS